MISWPVPPPPPEGRCESHADCTGHQACVATTCREVGCTSGDDCGVGMSCDGDTWSCVPGCATDSDCLLGASCDGGTCLDPDCESAVLDCALGERCEAEGCVAEEGLCEVCDPYLEMMGLEPCGSSGSCLQLQGAPQDMGFCFYECEGGDEPCAAGFTCEEFPDETEGYFAYCPTLLEQGWLQP